MEWSSSTDDAAWGVLRGSDTLTVPLWPLWLALLGAAVAITAVRRDGPPTRWWGLLSLAPLAGWGVAITLLSDRTSRLEALWPQVTIALLSSLAPLVVLARGAGRGVVLALPLVLQLIFMASVAFPFIQVDYAPHHQLGRSQTLSAEVRYADCPLEASEVVLEGDVPGEHRVSFEAICFGFRLRRTVVVTVGTDEADPRFPLVPGRHWHWTLTPDDGSRGATADGELLAARWQDGPLAGVEGTFRHQRVQLYGLDGRTWIHQRRTGRTPNRHFGPVFAAISQRPPDDIDGLDPADATGPYVFLPLMWRCERLATPPGGIEGPDDCDASVDRTDPVLAGLALLLTGGLALPAVMEGVNARATLTSSGALP